MTTDDFQAKPKPDMAINAQKKLSVEPIQSIMIGDTIHDIQMGKLAGFITIGVTWGYNTKQSLINAGADFIADDINQLQSLLNAKKILGGKNEVK